MVKGAPFYWVGCHGYRLSGPRKLARNLAKTCPKEKIGSKLDRNRNFPNSTETWPKLARNRGSETYPKLGRNLAETDVLTATWPEQRLRSVSETYPKRIRNRISQIPQNLAETWPKQGRPKRIRNLAETWPKQKVFRNLAET